MSCIALIEQCGSSDVWCPCFAVAGTTGLDVGMDVADWFLGPDERQNDDTCLDRRHPDGRSWTSGNEVVPLVHGKVYFAELLRCLNLAGPGDRVFFTDWRGDPDQALD